jgi:THO complex subunit 2
MEWMHIRNAITVLKGVIEYFPALEFVGNSMKRDLENIAQREQNSREDLSLLANALMPELVKRQSKWVIVQAFSTGTNLVSSPSYNPSVRALLTR